MENNLQLARKKAGYTGEQVAKKLNITRNALSYYENHKREASYETLSKLSQLYGVSIDYLLGQNSNNTATLKENDLGIITPQQTNLFKMIQKLDNDRFYMVYGYTERLLREMI